MLILKFYVVNLLYLSLSINDQYPRFLFTVPNPCMSNPCDLNADCLREGLLGELFSCTCRHPFQGTGFSCLSRFSKLL